jgi:hypothetical protein
MRLLSASLFVLSKLTVFLISTPMTQSAGKMGNKKDVEVARLSGNGPQGLLGGKEPAGGTHQLRPQSSDFL